MLIPSIYWMQSHLAGIRTLVAGSMYRFPRDFVLFHIGNDVLSHLLRDVVVSLIIAFPRHRLSNPSYVDLPSDRDRTRGTTMQGCRKS